MSAVGISNKTLIIVGPTAVGKSGIALDVAEKLGGEIVSADSMQIYRGLDIGTAKPTTEQLAQIPHHMIDVADPREPYSVAEYREAAGEALTDILSRDKLPVVVGGTGLYIHSLIYDMDFGRAKGDEGIRQEYEKLAREQGVEYVHALLAERDPLAAASIHPNNLKRVIRTLERISADAGDERTDVQESDFKPFGFDLHKGTLLNPVLVLLKRKRTELVERIDVRVDEMIWAGLQTEVEGLAAQGLTLNQISMLGIGYKEMLGYLSHDYDHDKMVELIKIHTRRYAKRQMTWFKRYEDVITIDLSSTDETDAANRIVALLC